MKIPRQSFAEVAWLYQNDSRKATVNSRAPEIGLVARQWKMGLLDLRRSYGVLLGTGGKAHLLRCGQPPRSNVLKAEVSACEFCVTPRTRDFDVTGGIALQIH